MNAPTIVRIAWAPLPGRRPRLAGSNARLGPHGQNVRLLLARVTASDGAVGWGWSQIGREQAAALVGRSLAGAVGADGAVAEPLRAIEYPLLDLAARRAGQPVYALLGGHADAEAGYRVRCYDTSLYVDDLHLADDDAAAALIAAEALEGAALGHRHFKIKVGRGAMHMDLEAGTRRDIAIIRAVRAAVGPGARLMVDANNGYNLNLAKRVLAETADVGLYWLEEAFHEDPRLYANLKEWLAAQGLATLIADGEGDASPRLLDYARDGLVDVIQYDITTPGISRWLELAPLLAGWGVRAAPHHYGRAWGNWASGHAAAAIPTFEMVEWDHVDVPGLDASGYRLAEGWVHLPAAPGFGLGLDEAYYAQQVAAEGYVVGG